MNNSKRYFYYAVYFNKITISEKGYNKSNQEVVKISKYELTDYQREQIKDLFSPETSKCGRARRDPKELMNAIIWVLRTGSPWCALPEKYGSWHTVYNNFRR